MLERIITHITKAEFTTLLYAWNVVDQEQYEDLKDFLEKLAIKFGYKDLIEAEIAVFKLQEDDYSVEAEEG